MPKRIQLTVSTWSWTLSSAIEHSPLGDCRRADLSNTRKREDTEAKVTHRFPIAEPKFDPWRLGHSSRARTQADIIRA
ncbi:hypothetical protein C8R44DRAFT_104941 [Mycena epipterygia]|nr:hypothetical protein C8R44DRAFT_104941 [Mycena epipterygia]